MIVIRQKMIYRADLQANPHILYVFGDNLQRVGMGGQAGEMRGEPNAFGFATKRDPGMSEDSFFYDDNGADTDAVFSEFVRIRGVLINRPFAYSGIVVPSDGLGSGLARLNETAPNLYRLINTEILKLGE